MNIPLLVLAFVIGIIIGRRLARRNDSVQGPAHDAVREKKEAAKRRIMEMFAEASEVTNDQVQQMLGVSDATATNYLSELEAEGKIVQIGREGSGVRYRKNG